MQLSILSRSRWRLILFLLSLALVLGMLPWLYLATVTHAASSSSYPHVFTHKGEHYSFFQSGTGAPTDAQCRAKLNVPCYSPDEMRTAYRVDALINSGYKGKGQSIVIIDSFGSPTITSDLQTFDAAYGLPSPPSFKIYAPLGTVPFDPNNSDMVGWAFETSLDVEWAHAMAPDANIVLMTSPVSETQGVQGMPQFLALEQYALNHHLGNIISQSWATTENTLFTPAGRQVISNFENFYKQAMAAHVTVFSSTGDSGVANPDVNGNIYPFPTVNFPASSPYVTAVGGTSLYADTQGNYQSEVAWSGSGGGVSQYFAEPDYQSDNLNKADQALLKGHRGIPDIAYNADPNTAILIYFSALPGQAGFYLIGGTSEGSPQWAGITADGNQLAGHPLGFLNESLYQLGNSSQYMAVYHDVTTGNNSASGITGYNATAGWDPVTGWGSPKASALFQAIIVEQAG